jgi:hypothetical protein
MNTNRVRLYGSGTQTSTLAFGGQNQPVPSVSAATEEYNGATWTSGNSMNTARS